MSTYFVGDIQGCYTELDALLTRVNFNPDNDTLIAVGDLVARGPDSLRVVERFMALGESATSVLGNHDLNLLSVLHGLRPANPNDQLDSLLNISAAKRERLVEWLCHRPLLIQHDNFTVTHAGIYPWWSLQQAAELAHEVEAQLQTGQVTQLLQAMYGNEPAHWSSSLSGFDRYRFIVNAFTRMRYCKSDGALNLKSKESPQHNSTSNLKPWFHWWPEQLNHWVIFGHWAALQGHTNRRDIIALDTGCVWGNNMTLMQWPERIVYTQAAVQHKE